METQSPKPKFDKKKWRENKYNKKLQVKHWEDKKKVILKSKLVRQLKKEQRKGNTTTYTTNALLKSKDNDEQRTQLSRIKSAQLQFKKKQEEKEKLKAQRLKQKEEIAKAMETYNKKKTENFRILSKKTKKGQPVMKGRMQLLFEQVKKTIEPPT